MGQGHLLPNGNIAETDDEYFNSWSSLSDKLYEIFGLGTYGFSPDIGISRLDGRNINSFSMPASVALKLIEVYENKK